MIDWDQVARLRDEIGETDFEEVMDLFLSEAQEMVAALSNEAEHACLEDVFHTLKGSSSYLGMKTFSQLCANSEKASAAGDQGETDIAGLKQCFNDSVNALKTGLNRSNAA